MNYYHVFFQTGTSELCTRNAVSELPSLAECIRDARASGILNEAELPVVIYRKRVLSHKRVRIILRETEVSK